MLLRFPARALSHRSLVRAAAAQHPSFPHPGADEALLPPSLGPPRAADGRVQLLGLRRRDLASWLASQGEKPSRSEQLFAVLYRHAVPSLAEASTVSAEFRTRLLGAATEDADLALTAVHAAADGTQKLVFRLGNGGGSVEAVVIPARNGARTTLCVSSQLGCAMNCQFCHTGRMGLRRNLSAAQIVGQALAAKQLLAAAGQPAVDNVVFMGMGEPLHNLEAVLTAVDILVDEAGFALSHNKVTVSTSGLLPQMRRFLAESSACLAVSLNATTEEVRSYIMPLNRKHSLAELLATLRASFPRAGLGRAQTRVFFEYVMLAGVNDSEADKERLVAIATSLPCKVNLIEFNDHSDSGFTGSPPATVRAFRDALAAAGVTATVRESRGDDAMAACGQLGKPDDEEAWKPPPPRTKPPKALAAL